MITLNKLFMICTLPASHFYQMKRFYMLLCFFL